MLQSSTGRRPTRSERRPQIGMNRNCMTREDRARQRGHEVARAEAARDPGQERDHQPEAEQVEEDGEEQRPQRGRAEPVCGRGRRRGGGHRRVALGQGMARLIASARAPPPGAGRAALGGARELVLPVDDAHGRAGAAGSGSAKEGLHGGGILAHPLDERGDIGGLARAGRRGRRTRAGNRRAAGAAPRSRARAADRPACAGDPAASSGVVRPSSARAGRPLGQRLQLGLDPLARDRGEQVVGVHQPEPLVELEERRRERERAAPARRTRRARRRARRRRAARHPRARASASAAARRRRARRSAGASDARARATPARSRPGR